MKLPHGKKSCDFQIEKQFIKWTKGKKVKRCPRCQMYTEKNEGCNHMTCVCCKYQWCWICEKQYIYGHYDSGTCEGQQFTNVDHLSEIKPIKREVRVFNEENNNDSNYFGLHKIFGCVFKPVEKQIECDEIWQKYILMILFWLFGVWIIYIYNIALYLSNKIPNLGEDALICWAFFIALNMLIIFQISFTSLITPFILISFFYPGFFDKILLFFEVGDD